VNACADGNADSVETLLHLKINNLTVREVLEENMGKIGEKLQVSKVVTLAAEKVVSYIHQGNKLGVLVALEGTDGVADVEVVGRDIAMQIAAMNPIAIDEKGVEPLIVEKELEIAKEQARAEGKPEDILEKIAMGKLNKFYQEVTLLGQEFFKDPSKNIAQYLKDKGANLKVVAFKRVVLGAKD
jgi:elongation factor Ts